MTVFLAWCLGVDILMGLGWITFRNPMWQWNIVHNTHVVICRGHSISGFVYRLGERMGNISRNFCLNGI